MALRVAWRAPRRQTCRIACAARAYSTGASSTYFTVESGPDTKDLSALLQSAKEQAQVVNTHGHDAAVLLTTPSYAKWLDNEGFLQEFVSVMAGSAKLNQFHLLAAAVDHVVPGASGNQSAEGVSVLRGKLDSILPDLWNPSPQRAREDANKVAALTVNLGKPQLTIPLANTTFLNHRTSTLIASRFDLVQGSPRLLERIEKDWQQISPPLETSPQAVDDLGIWAPLVPLTHSRIVTESFGNIVRRISVDGESIPASDELEPAVDELYKRKSTLIQAPMGVWAMILPPVFSQTAANAPNASDPDPAATFSEGVNVNALATTTSSRLQQLYGQGGRLYQILSGGGGWGAKKGLLSLDPQRTHFSLSEEEEMQHFIQAMDGGNFVPVGSKIQFFASTEALAGASAEGPSTGIVFGRGGPPQASSPDRPSDSTVSVSNGRFGALSNDGVFVSTPDAAHETTPGFNNDWRLNVPYSRILVRGN